MRVQLRALRRDDGAIAIMVALLVVVLAGVAAFTTDFGMAYAQRQALATGADSAALAVVRQQYKSVKADPRVCADLVTDDQALPANDPTKASAIALAQVNANAPFGLTLPASAVAAPLECVGSDDGTLRVTVTVNHEIDTTFGGVLGVSTMQVNRAAAAGLGVVNEVTGARPIALCNLQAQSIVDNAAADLEASQPYRAELVSLTKVWHGTSCSGSGGAGNWGWLDLGQGNSAIALGEMIASGSSTPITLNTTTSPPTASMNGTPGNKGNSSHTHTGMDLIMDKVITLPVYDTYSGNGANATYNVMGFLSVKMCGYDKTIKGACYDLAVPMQGDDMQLRYVDYSPIGQIGNACGIGLTCAFNAYATKLVR